MNTQATTIFNVSGGTATLSPYQAGKPFVLTFTSGAPTPSVPPIITNDGWESGMENVDVTYKPGDSFWVQDYGMDEPGRWTVDSANKAIKQSTVIISGSNVGSRAYPVVKDVSGEYHKSIN